MRIRKKSQSRDGSTKYLLELPDGENIETILIPMEHRRSKMCVSSQVGCVNKCSYCATGKAEFVRDLTASEILEQIDIVLGDSDTSWHDTASHYLFMGMGEPLFNFDSVTSAIECLIEDRRIAPMDIILSTSGVVAGIRGLARKSRRPRLAISVNSPFSSERDRLMPINKSFPLGDVITACSDYVETTGEKIILEYVLLHKTNTSLAHAAALAAILPSAVLQYHLIPFNSWLGARYMSPTDDEITRFCAVLEGNDGAEVCLKPSRGIDVGGGCGQLAGQSITQQEYLSLEGQY